MPSRYEAFISYSHAADGQLAPKLEQGLKRFARWWLQSSMPVFRDETTLALTAHLWPTIQQKINQSGSFILLASPEAAKSEWVDMEVRHWLATRGPDRLFIVLTSGTIRWDQQAGDFDWAATDALPPSLAGALPNEPKWENVGAVKTGSDISGRNPILEKAVASLYSAITGRPLEEVIGADVQRKHANQALASGVAAIIALSLGWVIFDGFEDQRKEIEQAKEAGRRDRHAATLGLARRWLSVGSPEAATATLIEGLSNDPVGDADGTRRDEFRWAVTEALHASHESVILQDDVELKLVSASPDGRWIATAGGRHIALLDARDQSVKATLDAGAEVEWLGFSQNSSMLLAWGKDRTARRWQLEEGGAARPLEVMRTGANVVAARFNDSGDRLVTLDSSGIACIDALDRHMLQCAVRLLTDRPISDIAWPSNGSSIAGVFYDGSVASWDTATGTQIASVALPMPTPAFPWKIVVEHQAGRAVTWVERDDNNPGPEKTHGSLFDLKGRALVRRLEFDRSRWIGGAVFSPDGKTLAVRTRDRAILVDAEAGFPRAHIVGNRGYIRDLVFSPDAATLATAAYDRSVRVWDAATGAARHNLIGHEDRVTQLAFSADGCNLTSVSLDKTLRIWSLAAAAWHRRLSEVPCDGRPRDPSKSASYLNSTRFSRDGTLVATASTDRKARVWDARTGSLVGAIERSDNVLAVDFDPSGSHVALGEGSTANARRKSELSVIEWRTGRIAGRTPLDGRARTVRFSPDGRHVLAAVGDGIAQILRFDPAIGLMRTATLSHDGSPVTSASWHPGGRRVVTTSSDKQVCLWTIDAEGAGDPARNCQRAADIVYDAAWNHAGDVLAAVDGDATIHIWRGPDLTGASKFKLLDDRFGAQVAFTPDDRHLVVRLNDGTILVRDVALGRDAYELKLPKLTTGFAISSDGRQLATTLEDGSARILQLYLRLDELVSIARNGLPRCLTKLQRQRYSMPWSTADVPPWCQSKWPYDTKTRVFRVPATAG